jgi:hypothetical protein
MATTPRKTAAKKTATPAEIEAQNVKLRDEITGNIERVQSLAEAENVEGVATLKEETEGLIAKLPTGERVALRSALTAASKAEKPEAKAEVELKAKAAEVVNLQSDYHNFEGVAELVDQAAEKVLEFAKASVSGGHELANITFYAWTRITKADGTPDLKGDTDAAKSVTKDAFDKVLKGLPEEGTNEEADNLRAQLGTVRKAMQHGREDVRVNYIRGLAHSPEEAARFGALVEGKKGADISTAVAAAYEITLLTRAEKQKALRDSKKALAAAEEKFEEVTGALDAVDTETAAKVEAGEMTEAEREEALKAANEAVAEATKALEAVKGEEKAATPAEELADALTKMSKFVGGLKAEGVAGLDAKKKDALRKKATETRDALIALLGNW